MYRKGEMRRGRWTVKRMERMEVGIGGSDGGIKEEDGKEGREDVKYVGKVR